MGQSESRAQVIERLKETTSTPPAEIATKLKSPVSTERRDVFFDRKDEMGRFLNLFKMDPRFIITIIGPNDCGKTAFLKRFVRIWKAQNIAVSPILYLDCRLNNVSTPRDAALALKFAFKSAVDWLGDLAKAGQSLGVQVPIAPRVTINAGVQNLISALSESTSDAELGDLLKVMNKFTQLMSANKEVHPIFILDEANNLKHWDEKDLDLFMGTFKALTKQNGQAYLVLATSDDFFRTWLSRMFHGGLWRPFGIGGFSKDDARGYMETLAIPRVTLVQGSLPAWDDATWETVYGVCGGMPLLLDECALNAFEIGNWNEAVEAILEYAMLQLEDWLVPNSTYGWTTEHFKGIIHLLASSTNGAVGVSLIITNVYENATELCKDELQAMVKRNALHIRYFTKQVVYSDLVRDGTDKEYVMAKSPALLAAMKKWTRMQGIGATSILSSPTPAQGTGANPTLAATGA